jgi:PKD repeat protein
MLDHLTITVPGVPDELRTPGVFVHISDPWQNGVPAPVAPGGSPTYADFTATPLTGNAPLAVQFTDLSTTPRGAWAWNFGDGGTSTAQNPTHTYAASGTYTVTLTATGPDGADSKTRNAYIEVVAAGILGTWIITTDTAGLARIGEFGGSWADVPLPGTFIPSTGNGATGLAIVPNGSGGTFMAGTGGTTDGVFSPDNASWTYAINGGTAATTIDGWITDGIYAFDKYIMGLAANDGEMAESANGMNWTSSDPLPATFSNYWSFCAHSDGYVYAAGVHVGAGVGVIRTNDGTTWSVVRAPAIDTPFLSDGRCFIVSDGSRLVVMDRNGRVSTSANGTTWTPLVATAITAAAQWDDWLTDMSVGGGRFVAVTDDESSPNVWSAGSDLVFTGQTLPTTTGFHASTFASDHFVIVGLDSKIYASPMGIEGSWELQDVGFAAGKKLTGVARIA